MELSVRWLAKSGRGQFQTVAFNARLAAGDGKHRLDLFRKNPFTAHARAEARVVEFAASNGADAVQHFFFSRREMTRQPLLEQRRDGVGQAEDDVAGELCARL